MKQTEDKDLNYYKENAEKDYYNNEENDINLPISVLRYISELEGQHKKLASYKAELREKILDLVYVIPDYDSGKEAEVIDYSSIKALLEDNPTEK